MAETYKDVLEAITSGLIPGAFNDDRTAFIIPPMEYKDAKNKVRYWGVTIMLREDGQIIPILDRMLSQPTYKFAAPIPPSFTPKNIAAYTAVIRVNTGYVGGDDRDGEDTIISTGKNLKNVNATNCITQAFREAYSKYKTKARGKLMVELAENAVPPSDGVGEFAVTDIIESHPTRVPPMLPSKTSDCKWGPDVFAKGVSCQPKYNGHRVICYVDKMTNEVICYSRNLETYTGLVDISNDIKQLTLPPKPSDVTVFFDGELYCHGMSLQDISGLVRAKDDRDKGALKLVIFDVFFNYSSWAQKISSERQAYLAEIFNLNTSNTKYSYLQLAPIYKITSMADAFKKADEFVANGYEGAVIRRDDGKYDYSYNGRHTTMAYKVKRREEHEFMIVAYEQGTRGKAANMMLWVCQTEPAATVATATAMTTAATATAMTTAATPIAKQFNVMINMTNDDNRKLFEYLNEHPVVFEKYFKHRYVNIEYAELSKDGVPLQAKATTLFRHPPFAHNVAESSDDEDFYVEINEKFKNILLL